MPLAFDPEGNMPRELNTNIAEATFTRPAARRTRYDSDPETSSM
jgi:hypothetical protein